MTRRYLQLTATPAVKAAQEANGSRRGDARMDDEETTPDALSPAEAAFIESRDSFYVATVSATGWPYVQHRGGPPGFVKVLDERTLGVPDYRGNRQYISLGNVAGDDRVALIFMNYPVRQRLKLLGRMKPVDLSNQPVLAARLAMPDYTVVTERALLIDVEAFDWNCPQHITPRFTRAQVDVAIEPIGMRIAALEAENAALREALAERGANKAS